MLSQDVDKALKEMQARNAHWQQKLALLREEYERDVKEMGDLQIAMDDEDVGDAAEGGEGDEAMAEGKEAAADAARRKVGLVRGCS